MKSFAMLIARCLIGIVFLADVVDKILQWDAVSASIAAKGIQMVPAMLVAAIAVELFGGLSLIAGARARLGALALALYLIPATFLFHDFWTFPPGEPHAAQLTLFLNNCAIFGGLLYIICNGAGRLSRDYYRNKRLKALHQENEEK